MRQFMRIFIDKCYGRHYWRHVLCIAKGMYMGEGQVPEELFADLLVDEMRLRFLKGRRTTSRPQHGGWYTPPNLHLLHVVEGRFDFEHPATGKTVLGVGACMLVVPDALLRPHPRTGCRDHPLRPR